MCGIKVSRLSSAGMLAFASSSWSKENNKSDLQLVDFQLIGNKTSFNFKLNNNSFKIENNSFELNL